MTPAPLSDTLPEERGMSAREALAEALAMVNGLVLADFDPPQQQGFRSEAYDILVMLRANGFDVLPSIPIPKGAT